MPTRAWRWFWVILVSLIGLAVILIGAEAAYRSRLERAGGQPLIRYYRHKRLTRAMVRGVDYGDGVHINRYGFRGPDFDSLKAAGTIRIMTAGAGTTLDPCVRPDAQTWPARLEYWLNELGSGRKFQVINAGVAGAPMLDQVIRLQTELHAYNPDVFVVYANHGIVNAQDLEVNPPDAQRPEAAIVTTPWADWLERHSRLYERFRAGSKRDVKPRRLSDEEWNLATENAARAFERDLLSFGLIANGLNAKLVFAEINRVTGARTPDQFTAAEYRLWERNFASPPRVVLSGYQRFKTIWRDVATRTGATFIPVETDPIIGAANFCENDVIHFNKVGSNLMGQRMAKQLLEHALVN